MDKIVLLIGVAAAVIFILLAYVYIRRRVNLEQDVCDYMNTLYPTLNGNIRPISSNDSDCSGNLYDYYIKTAFNACSGGSYKDDYVDLCNLKAVLKQGVRCLDFEVYSVDNQPVVATSTSDSYYIKETFNYVDFGDVMKIIRDYAFSTATAPNTLDPIIIHLRIKSNNQEMYKNFAKLLFDCRFFIRSKICSKH